MTYAGLRENEWNLKKEYGERKKKICNPQHSSIWRANRNYGKLEVRFTQKPAYLEAEQFYKVRLWISTEVV